MVAALPFENAFVPDGARFSLKTDAEPTELALSGKTVVKIAGKNGIPKDMPEFDKFKQALMRHVLALGKRIVVVFDGDNYEPDKTPFSVLIRELSPHVEAVLAVKQRTPHTYSGGFVNGWKDMNGKMYFLSVDEEANEWTTRHASVIVNLFSNRYPLRPDGTETTGFKQLKQQKEMQGARTTMFNDAVTIVDLRVEEPVDDTVWHLSVLGGLCAAFVFSAFKFNA